ncbi:MAG: putative oxidoreductase YcjS [Lentisphaerae bacterium ADurb.Bin242]|nr:MAG: putative oxidoreductase YcjS [Lentisphaerae bacterium ADurb.Bin242]
MTEKLTAILVGAGSITNAWLPVLRDRGDVEIIAVADPRCEAAEARIREFALPARPFPDLAQALEKLRPDMVFDCSIPSAHCANSLLALRHGCHVLSEKPMAGSVAEARRIVATAREANRIHAVIQNRRYMNDIIACREAVRSGIGVLTTLNADFYIGAHFGGFRDVMDHVLLLDMAIHSFDQARFLSGCDAEKVFCKEWNPAGSWYRHGASAVAVFTMSGGLVFTYRGSWCAEGCPTSWECDWRAVGTSGTVLWRQNRVSGESIVRSGGKTRECAALAIPEVHLSCTGHAGVIDEFLRCVRTGARPQTSGDDNIRSLAMVEGAIRSAETGLETTIE